MGQASIAAITAIAAGKSPQAGIESNERLS